MRLFMLVFLIAVAGLAQAARLSDVRVSELESATRVVLDLSDSAEHAVFTLANPDRVVIDLAQVTGSKLRVKPRGAVKGIRFGQRGRDLRVVLDLRGIADVTTQTLTPQGGYGHRLVLDLAEINRPLPAPEAVALAPADKTVIVAIDPGHGGKDSGAIGHRGTQEKVVALQIARRLQDLINAEPGMKAVLTRTGDYFIPLRERIRVAQEARADLFISIHADAFDDRRAHGSSVYALSQRGATSEHAKLLAQRENAADLIGGVALQDKDELLASVLLDISQNAAIEASMEFGEQLLPGLKQLGHLHKKSVQRAAFVVLKAPDIPSVLVETAFISNPSEEKNLRSSAHQDKLARALHSGIRNYFHKYRPQQLIAGAPAPGRYQIRSGDTLSEIAVRYGTNVAALRQANRLNSDLLRVGDILTIPRSDT